MVSGETSTGRKYDKYGVFNSIVNAIIIGDLEDVSITYVCPFIQKYIDTFKNHVAFEYNGKKILKYIPRDLDSPRYEVLYAATNKFIYYSFENELASMFRMFLSYLDNVIDIIGIDRFKEILAVMRELESALNQAANTKN